jgi:hypothetical protein
MVEAGGQKLAKKVVVGNLATKAADALLADLETHRYIRKDGKSFTLTDEGRQAWNGRATEARKRELADRAVADFLAAVVKQNGRALTAGQKKQFDADFIQRVQADGLVVEAGPNKFKLSPTGEGFLQARELEEQLKPLRTATQDLLKKPQALLQRFAADTEQLAEAGPVRAAFEDARRAIQEDVARAQQEFERSLDGLRAYASLMAAAQTFKKALPDLSGTLERIEAEVNRVQKLHAELRQTAHEFKEQLQTAQQQMEQRVAAVEEKAQEQKKPTVAGTSTPLQDSAKAAEPTSEEAVWQATRRAYEQLEQQFKLTSELIKVPNLTDRVRAEVPGLTADHFHELLQRWQREDRLVLQVCNDPEAESRTGEGIPSPRGLLFYVEMK